MRSLIQRIKNNRQLKSIALRLLMPKGQARPRLWVKFFYNPLVHKKGNGATIRPRTRMDVLPFNRFEMGKNSTIEDFCVINNGMGDVLIGDRSRVGISSVVIGPAKIGNDVILAQHVVMSGLNHGYEDVTIPIKNQKCTVRQIIVEDEAWIGANAVITAGITIGRHAVVAAGSVVTKDVAPFTVVGGNPARILKAYDFEKQAWIRPVETTFVAKERTAKMAFANASY